MTKTANWNELPLETVRHGVTRKVFSGEKATLCFNYVEPGHEPKPHSHPHEQISYIISGRGNFHVGAEVILMGAGGVVMIPGDVVHYLEVVGDETVVNLDVFSPRRDEYGG